MKLYHGSPHKFSRFLSPEESGNFRPSEENRGHHRDVIFLTSDKEEALRYAGAEGFLYIVNASFAKPYLQEGKKKPKPRAGVYISDPGGIKINLRLRLAPRKRRQLQEYVLDN